jgi:ubiquinone/menaquinone biosynthesis C-methylase UbiE
MKLQLLICLLFFAGSLQAQRKNTPEAYFKIKRKKVDVILRAARIEKHDVVADVGSGEGWLDAAFGVYVDSVQFYLEDIDSSLMTNKKLTEALTAYSNLRGKPISSVYRRATGSDKSTGLPVNTFDKVLLIDSFHHFTFRDEMLADLFRILKMGGKLVVYDPVARREGAKYKLCKKKIYTEKQITDAFVQAGFAIGPILKTVNSARTRVRAFIFMKR